MYVVLGIKLCHQCASVCGSVMNFLFRFDPYGKSGFAICRICKSSVHQSGSHYCQGCAYKKGADALSWKTAVINKETRAAVSPCGVDVMRPGSNVHIIEARREVFLTMSVLSRNLCNVWEESSGHQELQANICLGLERSWTDVRDHLQTKTRQDLSAPALFCMLHI